MGSLGSIVPDPIRERLVVKFALVLLVMGLVIVAVGFTATDQVTAETKQNVEAEYQSLAASEATLVEEWVQRNRLTTQLVSKNDAWTGEGDQQMSIALRTKLSTLPNDIANVYVVDTAGGSTSVVSSTAESSSVSFSQEAKDWLRQQQFDQAATVRVSGPYESGGEQVIAFASLVGSGRERVFLMEVRTSAVAESLQSAERTEGTFVQVVNGENTIVLSRGEVGGHDGAHDEGGHSSSVGTTYGGGNEHALEPVTLARNLDGGQTAGVLTRSGDHGDEVVGYAPVQGSEWAVIVHSPRSEVFGAVQAISNYGLLATGFLAVLVAVIGAALGYSVTSSLDRLADKAREMEQGNLNTDFSTSRVDEIGQLYTAFDSMRKEVRKRILDAEEAQDEAQGARSEAQRARAEAEELARHLEEKADRYSEVMQQCADGDLTQRLDTQSKSDAMRQIGTSFNEMVTELERAIESLTDFAEEVAEEGRVVNAGAENVSDASEQVASSIQRISDDAHQQVERLQIFSESLDEAVASLDEIPDGELDAETQEDIETLKQLCGEIDELTDLSEQTMAESENVAAAAEEQTSALREVSQSAEDLIDYAEPLRSELERFSTDAEHQFQFGTRSQAED